MEQTQLRIGIAIVERADQVLVGVRDPGTVLGGKHEFPGGKCQPLESPAECAARECLEESGLRVRVNELLMHTRHRYPHGELDLYFFLCALEDETAATPQGNFCWVGIDALTGLNFPSGNVAAIQKLVERYTERRQTAASSSSTC